VLAFDPGNGTQKKYTLSNGYYEWRVDQATGWDLYKTKVALEIDNSRYDGVFEYLVNGELARLEPGEVAEHSSDVLIEIAFHSGREGLEHRKLLKPGRYMVGLDPNYGAIDLFAADKVENFEAKQPGYIASTSLAGSRATKKQRIEALLAQLKKPGTESKDVVAPQLAGKTTAKKPVSPLGKKKTSASAEDLLKSLKSKAASIEKGADTTPVLQSSDGQASGPMPVIDGQEKIIAVPTPVPSDF
jgi:hypothetical protein